MKFIIIAIIGLLAGLLARMLKPGPDRMGLIVTALLGIAGAVLATWAGQALGLYRPGQPAGFIGAVAGAIALLYLYGWISKR